MGGEGRSEGFNSTEVAVVGLVVVVAIAVNSVQSGVGDSDKLKMSLRAEQLESFRWLVGGAGSSWVGLRDGEQELMAVVLEQY